MNLFRRFADRVTRSELSAQKTTNAKLHKVLRYQTNRGNALSVHNKQLRKRATAARKEARMINTKLRMVRIDLDSALRDDPLNRERLETVLMMAESFTLAVESTP